jgi:alpha-1,2-mannosyltransferase
VAFYIFLISNGLAAAYAPIQDCDETFNYWEPTHFLDHGYGLQTWEYSPEYSIRSWLYILLHAAVGKVISIWSPRKTVQFYAIRFALAFICAACETRLYSAISRRLNPRIGLLFLVIVAYSPGFFHASSAFLPSSFAMYSSMLGLAAFLDRQGKQKTAEGIMWFGVGAILGWPFAGALMIPLLLEECIVSIFSGNIGNVVWDILNGATRCFLILVSFSLQHPLYELLR